VERFSRLPRISIDFAVMEKASSVAAVAMGCDWLDVGSWISLTEIIKPDQDGNIIAGADLVSLNSGNNILVTESPHLIAAIGIDDLIVIHSADATLICRRGDTQKIKDLYEAIKSKHGQRYT
jgi:mannose-1-phosphate guanylyltransferase